MSVVAAVALVCCAALLAWRWRLDFQRWQLERADKQRDEALAELEPRMTRIEKQLKDAAYAKTFK